MTEAEIKEKSFRLEVLLRQQHRWVIEDHPASRAHIAALYVEMAALREALGVTDDAQFLRGKVAAR